MNEIEIRISARNETGPGTRQAEQGMRSGVRRIATAAGAGLAAGGVAAGGLFAKGLADNMNIEVANDRLAAQLGLTTEEAKKAGEVAGEVYGNNWGGSIEEVNAAIKSVGNNLGDVGKMSKTELQGMTEDALALAQTFDVDVNSSTAAAAALIKNGLAKTSTEAFDIITAGFQNGADKAEDFTDTLTEYSPQFRKLGFDGKYALDLLSEGLKAGARDTDVIADGFKEFGLRAIDGSKTTVQAYKDIGLDADKTAAAIAKGGPAAQKATQQVLEGLLGIKDPIKQNNAGVGLFGTTWEDTVRQILPALANADGAIEQVDGSTKRMADTVGDNAQGKIDTLKRGFEQWTQSMASSDGALGTMVTGVTAFGGGALQAGSQIGMMAVAMKGLNLTMLMNPIGLVVAAIALLVGGLILLWKNSQKAREIMSTAFDGITQVVLTGVQILLKAYQAMSNGVLSVVEGILRALGKIPGNDWADRAAEEVKGFRNSVNDSFNKAISKTDEWKEAASRLPKKIKLEGDISDLNSKINQAKARLKEKGLTNPQKTQVRAEIAQLQAQVKKAKANLATLTNKNVYVNVITTKSTRIADNDKATGGIVGAASGGVRGSWTMVGEQGRELVRLPYGSQVTPHGATENIMAAGSGGGGMVLEIKSGGSRMDDLLVEILRRAIRGRGGDAQSVLGS